MKFVFVIGTIQPGGGAEKQSLILARSFQQIGHEVAVFSRRIDKGYLAKFCPEVQLLSQKKDLWRQPKDTLFVTFLAEDHITGFLLSIFGRKWVPFERTHPRYYLKHMPSFWLKRHLKFLMQWCAYKARASALLVQTKSARQAWANLAFDSEKIHVISNVFDRSIERKIFSFSSAKPKILCVCRLIAVKDPLLIIQIAHKLKSLYRMDFILDIFGNGPMQDVIKDAIQQNGLGANVFLKGFVENLDSVYKDYDIFLLTSQIEGMPNALGEAMLAGLPCVTTGLSGVARELVSPENEIEAKQIVETREAADLAHSIYSLLNNHKALEHLSTSNFERIQRISSVIFNEQIASFVQNY